MSRTFSTNIGSLESLNCSTRCGCSPNARQIFDTAVWLSPVAAAILRVDQCVPPSGGSVSNVRTITSSTCASVIFRGWPGRGSSNRPARRRSTNRLRHLPTICSVTPNSPATAAFVAPAAHASTIRDRNASACAVFGRRANRSSSARSNSVNTNSAFGRPVRAIHKFYMELTTQDTSALVAVGGRLVLHHHDRSADGVTVARGLMEQRQDTGQARDRSSAPVDRLQLHGLAFAGAAQDGAQRGCELLRGQADVEVQEMGVERLVGAQSPQILGMGVPDLHALLRVEDRHAEAERRQYRLEELVDL